MYLSENTSFGFLPMMEGGLRQHTVMQSFPTILLNVLQVGRQCKCSQNVCLIRDSTPGSLSPLMGLDLLLTVWDVLNFKSRIYWTATHQLKNLLEAEVCQRYVSGIGRMSAFFTFHMKNIDFVHTFISI